MAPLTHLARSVSDTPGGLLRQRVAADPGKVALHYPRHGTRLTFEQWYQQSEAFAKSLLDLGLEKGDRLALLAENRVEWSVVQMAAALGGFILVPVNTHSRSDDLLHALHQSQSRAVVLTESFRSNAFLELVDSIRDQLPDLEHTIVIAPSPGSPWPSLDSLIDAGARSATALPEVRGDDPGVIIYTSGTTGRPKGVVLRHAGVIADGRAVFERMQVTEPDVVTSIVPMFHSASFCAALPGCLVTGATYVGIDAFDALEMMEIIQSEKVTVHVAVPTTMRAILQHPRRAEFDLSSLRVATCGGADSDPAMLKACISAFPVPNVLQGYGLTEASALVTQARPGPDQDMTTAGFPLTGYRVRIVSTETGEVLPPLVSGEIQVLSDNVMAEYFRLPEETAKAFTADGWLKTGDLGELTETGELRMTGGRLKDMIIRGGENIYPAEIEYTLSLHPQVREVAVFGLPDPELGEIVAAAMILNGEVSPEELKAFCSERIARYKAPTVYYVVTEFPLTPSAKIRKNDLRAQAVAGALTPVREEDR